MDSKDEPLLQAALMKDPKGPWAAYLSMKFAQTRFKTHKSNNIDQASLYRESLNYLSPARDTLIQFIKDSPYDKELQNNLNQIEKDFAFASLEAGLNFSTIKSIAETMLIKNTDSNAWNYGNIIFDAHTLLGRLALREGKLNEAKKHLLASGHTPGSPQLNSFGPSFILARELAERGEYDTVISFLDLVAHFWANPDERAEANTKRVASKNLKQLNSWKEELHNEKIPDNPKWW